MIVKAWQHCEVLDRTVAVNRSADECRCRSELIPRPYVFIRQEHHSTSDMVSLFRSSTCRCRASVQSSLLLRFLFLVDVIDARSIDPFRRRSRARMTERPVRGSDDLRRNRSTRILVLFLCVGTRSKETLVAASGGYSLGRYRRGFVVRTDMRSRYAVTCSSLLYD